MSNHGCLVVENDTFDTSEQTVAVTARVRGYYRTPQAMISLEMTCSYSEGFSLEEIISDMSMDLALEFQKRFNAKCWMSYIHIEDIEDNTSDYYLRAEDDGKVLFEERGEL